MKRKSLITLFIVLALIVAVSPIFSACGAEAPAPAPAPAPKPAPAPAPAPKPVEKETYYMCATLMTSHNYPVSVAFAKLATENIPELYMVPREATGGFTENLSLIDAGEIPIGTCTLDVAKLAYDGSAFYKDKFLMPYLRQGWSYNFGAATIFVREDSGITDITQLDGKPFGAGYAGSNTHYKTMAILEDGVGIKPDWMIGGSKEIFDAVRDGKILGALKFGFPTSMVTQLDATVPMRILGITEEQAKRANEKHPGQFPYRLMDAGIYRGQDEPIGSFWSISGMIIDSKFPQEYVYKMTKVLGENPDVVFKDHVAEAMQVPKTDGVDWIEAQLKYSIIPLHAGIVQYFEEEGYTVPPHLIPPEYVK